MSNEITKEEMLAILSQKIAGQKQAYYSYKVDAQIAGDINDERMKKAAADNMKRTQEILDELEKMVKEIE